MPTADSTSYGIGVHKIRPTKLDMQLPETPYLLLFYGAFVLYLVLRLNKKKMGRREGVKKERWGKKDYPQLYVLMIRNLSIVLKTVAAVHCLQGKSVLCSSLTLV